MRDKDVLGIMEAYASIYAPKEELTEEVQIAAQYFYEMGLNEDGVDILIEELGVEEFAEFVYDIAEEYVLTEARAGGVKIEPKLASGKAIQGKPKAASLKRLRAQKAERAAGEAKASAAKPSGMKASLQRQSAVSAAAKKQPKKPGLLDRMAGAVNRGIERHNAAMGELKKMGAATAVTAGKVKKAADEFKRGFTSEEVELDEGAAEAVVKAADWVRKGPGRHADAVAKHQEKQRQKKIPYAALHAEEAEYIDEAGKNDARIRQNIKSFGSNYTPPSNWSQSENRGKGATISPKQVEKRRRKEISKNAMEELEIIDERKYEPDETLPSGRTPLGNMERAQGRHGANIILSRGSGRNNPARDSHFDRGHKVNRIKNIVSSGGDPRNDSRVGPGWDNDARKIGRTQNPTGGSRRRNASDDEKSNYSQGGLRAHKTKAGGYRTLVRHEEFEGDLFDYILEHLVAEGYADTNKAAIAIMANMSEEWKQSIVEASEEDKERLRNYEVRYYQKHGGMPPDPEKRRQLRDAARRLPPA